MTLTQPGLAMKPIILMLFALALVRAGPVAAAQFCVGGGNDLQDALSAAAGNGQTTISACGRHLYPCQQRERLEYFAFEDFDLSVSGGWNSTCTGFSMTHRDPGWQRSRR